MLRPLLTNELVVTSAMGIRRVLHPPEREGAPLRAGRKGMSSCRNLSTLTIPSGQAEVAGRRFTKLPF